MTPDSDSMRTNNTVGGTGGMGSSNSGGANARSGSMSMDKSDIFGVRPASSGSANNSGFVVNPENLLNAAAQMASAFAASDMDYLGGRTGNQFNDFASAPSAVSRFTNPQSTTASAFMPPTSKLNPNAPDFMRPSSTSQQDYRMRNQQQQQNLLNKNNFNMMSQQAPPPLPPTAGSNSFNRFNNSNNLPNILTNQGINAYLQSQTGNQFQSQGNHPLNNSTSIDLAAFDTNILSGRSIKEINELIAGATGPPPGPPGPPPGPPTGPTGGPAPGNPGFNYFDQPKFNSGFNSKPIGSERSRLEPLLKQPLPSNNPWDMSGLYDTLGTASVVNNDFGGFLGGLDAFNGFANPPQQPQTGVPQGPVPQAVLANTQVPAPTPQQQQQQQDYMSPVMGMTPQVTPSGSDYGDYSVASGLPMMSTAPPGVTSSAGKKQMGYLDQQQPMTGLAGRGDPASVRRNMNQSWGKKWGDE